MKLKSEKAVSTIVFAVLICLFGYVSAFAQTAPNYCHDEDPGKFTFSVLEAIHIECEGDVDLGMVCPGCSSYWECGEDGPVMIFNATGAADCQFIMTKVGWAPIPHILLNFLMYYWDPVSQDWYPYQLEGQPDSFFDVNTDGHGDYKWGAFIEWFGADCEATAGYHEVTLTVKVDYVCL